MPELLFLRDGELQMRAPLAGPRVVLGRSSDADWVVPDRAVSRIQCELQQRTTGWVLVDRSGRGTLVGQRTATDAGTVLRDGDEIRAGAYVLVFSHEAAERTREETLSGDVARRGNTGRFDVSRPALPRRARLRVSRGTGEDVLSLRPDEGWKLTVGKDPEGAVQLQLDDAFVSKSHCRIAWRKGAWVLSDLGSRNGTFVDGLRVTECWLPWRAAIRLGETTLWFEEESAVRSNGNEPLPGLVTHDPAMLPVIEQLRRIAPSAAPVCVFGESGTGKEVVSQAIHRLSERREGPFVALNCGALPKETLESELFGHEKGAFTGADRARAGAFEESSGGTLFLDEIGDLPLSAQVKLLRVLERGELRRLGGNRTISVDVRIVCATHRNLAAMVEDGSFREDLYWRLCVAQVDLPPLRHRLADVVPLAEHFLERLGPATQRITLSPSARARLQAHPWPGNARELRNVIQLALLQRRGPVLTEDDFTFRAPPKKVRGESLQLAGRSLAEIEREAFRLALERHRGDRRAAMEELQVPRSTFFRKLAEYGFGGD